jgi:hypothetical protein
MNKGSSSVRNGNSRTILGKNSSNKMPQINNAFSTIQSGPSLNSKKYLLDHASTPNPDDAPAK